MRALRSAVISDLSNISGLCRACLTESKTMFHLDTIIEERFENAVSTITDVLRRVTITEIICDERYPSYICRMCWGLLNLAYKFQLQFEESQKSISEYFGKSTTEELKPAGLQFCDDNPSVELISQKGRFDLKDIVVIEVADDEKPDYSGFLQNLGKEVSASFVRNNSNVEKIDKIKQSDTVSIIDLHQSSVNSAKNDQPVNGNIDNHLETLPDLTDDMDESDKKINRRISRCAICQKVFANKQYLHGHVERVHVHKKQTYICEICGVVLKSRSSHYHHMGKHVGKRHKCNVCHKMYFNASNLQQHIRSKHTNERPHLCTICGKTFSYANALDYHMRIHTGERKYKCLYCDRTFTMQCGLNRHIRVHTGHRPYKCQFCEKAFRSKGEVDCHEMLHTGYRPHHCKYCGKGFTKTFNLKMHLMGHSGDHACEFCNKTFIEPEYLKQHTKALHNCIDTIEGIDNVKDNL